LVDLYRFGPTLTSTLGAGRYCALTYTDHSMSDEERKYVKAPVRSVNDLRLSDPRSTPN